MLRTAQIIVHFLVPVQFRYFTLCWDLSIQYGENPTPVTFRHTKVDLEEYAPASHAEYLALIDQDESFLNASENPLDSVVDELAEGMDIWIPQN